MSVGASTHWVRPDWPAPAWVRSAVSTRQGPGVSLPPYDRFNLGLRNGDDPVAAQSNRAEAIRDLVLPGEPRWLRQVHGVDVAVAGHEVWRDEPRADASVTRDTGQTLAILTADCLPVLFCSTESHEIGAAHAGWRGLQAGVLEATVAQMRTPTSGILAWLGPCIGQASYEVGEEVRDAFAGLDAGASAHFQPTRPGHWLCDLAGLARRRLHQAGVTAIYGGGFDTFSDPRFYSYRQEGPQSGRFASFIWIAAD